MQNTEPQTLSPGINKAKFYQAVVEICGEQTAATLALTEYDLRVIDSEEDLQKVNDLYRSRLTLRDVIASSEPFFR